MVSKEKFETVEVNKISILLRSLRVSGDISEELDQIEEGENMDKQRIDIKVNISKSGSEIILAQEVKTSIFYFEEIFRVAIGNPNDNEVKSRKDGISKHLFQLENLSKKVHNLLKCFNSVTEDKIESIAGSYNHIKKLKHVYEQTIKDEVAKQEISKIELFNKSKLTINLSKFSEYDSKLDTEAYQSELIKIISKQK